MTQLTRIPPDVARQIGHYVYLYRDPLDTSVFYVGKGRGSRILTHVLGKGSQEALRRCRELRREGREPLIEILAHGLDAATAFRMEAALIDLIGLPRLTNEVRGHRSTELGRMSIRELVAHYRRKPVVIREPCVLIRINQLYRPGMSPVELYDVTRARWRVGERRNTVRYAMAVFQGVVREVYEITQWFPAGRIFSTRGERGVPGKGRWEFVGRVADESVRRRYVDRYVGHYFRRGNQNPIAYAPERTMNR
jgi:uncharacterized protein